MSFDRKHNLTLQYAKPAVITGGAGFVGTNLAHRLASSGKPVILFDNLSRPGVEGNVQWLKRTYGDLISVEIADIRDTRAVRKVIKQAGQVYHLAAQVAVTTSLDSPILDMEVNILGTLNLLEAIRAQDNPPPLLFTSTNKVYGALEDLPMHRNTTRYEPEDCKLKSTGISEKRWLDFHSPYGCSKGAADQYVIDYARVFDLKTVVFRMSCIYGPHQFGTEDQGWVAHFLIRALDDKPITIYGDGMQVRDILFVEDLVDAFMLAQERINDVSGQAFNIGGGPGNTISLIELVRLIEEMDGEKPQIQFGDWRPGDQLYYVTDTRKFQAATGWKQKHNVREGVLRLYGWLAESRKPAAARIATRKGA